MSKNAVIIPLINTICERLKFPNSFGDGRTNGNEKDVGCLAKAVCELITRLDALESENLKLR